MAQKTVVTVLDDLDGSEGASTVGFGLDGTRYEIDLSAEHEAELREILSRYIAGARKISKGPDGGTVRSAPPSQMRRTELPPDREILRRWQVARGEAPIGPRGRLPVDLLRRFREDPSIPEPPPAAAKAPTGGTARARATRRARKAPAPLKAVATPAFAAAEG